MASISPTQRSLALLRQRGYLVHIAERWNPFAHIRQDAFGVLDLIAVKPGEILGVQTTSDANLAARRTKLLAADATLTLILAGFQIVLHGWSKKGPRGMVKRWTCREEPLTADDFDSEIPL